jgi:hypothetical protein
MRFTCAYFFCVHPFSRPRIKQNEERNARRYGRGDAPACSVTGESAHAWRRWNS